jgi:hypothetical protein
MQTSALNAPFISAHTTAMMPTIVLWIALWSAPTKPTPLLTSALTVSPSERSNADAAAFGRRIFLDGGRIMVYDISVVFKRMFIKGFALVHKMFIFIR